MRKRQIFSLLALLALIASLAVAATALADHAPGGVIITDIQRGTLATAVQSHNLGQNGVNVKTRGPVDVATAEVTFEKGGGSAGWHTHPGPVFVVIRSGTLSVWDEDCMKTTYSAGSVLFETGPGHTLLVKNESETDDATVYGTFIVPVGADPLTVTTEHLCGIEE
jgi:quercetin dioxygenase-like cupin family protein